MNNTKTNNRALANKIQLVNDHLIVQCGHCHTSNHTSLSSLEEIDKINLADDSAQITYNFDCTVCENPNQLHVIVKDKE